jgi:hypothetical protein
MIVGAEFATNAISLRGAVEGGNRRVRAIIAAN